MNIALALWKTKYLYNWDKIKLNNQVTHFSIFFSAISLFSLFFDFFFVTSKDRPAAPTRLGHDQHEDWS